MTRTWKTIPQAASCCRRRSSTRTDASPPSAGGRAAFGAAYLYFWNLRRKKELILCKTEGLEHLAGVKGAVITCNHFHPMDSFIMQKVFDASKHPKRMYRVIREGNYTSFPGFYGFLMRNCNTLPLSSNMQTMKKFLRAVDQVLSEGNCLLIYPEQSMWWNYRKPQAPEARRL